MGNKSSSVKRKGQSASSDSEEDEEEIIEEETVEFFGFTNNNKCAHKEEEDPINEENGFIGVKQLDLSKLPEDIRDPSVLDYIKVQEKLVAQLVISECSKHRQHKMILGTGWVCVDRCNEFEKCPLDGCEFGSGQNHKSYDGLYIWTNKHVIYDNFEARNCEVFFFYDEPNAVFLEQNDFATVNGTNSLRGSETGVSSDDEIEEDSVRKEVGKEGASLHIETKEPKVCKAQGLCLLENNENKDLVKLKVIFHNPELHSWMSKFSDRRTSSWEAIPPHFKTALKSSAIVISHPKGYSKMISFGKLLCLEEKDEYGRRVTRYDTPTREGSSGAPVLNAHYSYRPFTHSSKIRMKTGVTGKETGYCSASYSY